MRLLQQTSLTIVTRWASVVLDGFASILVARYTGPGGKGILAVVGVIAGLVVQIGNLGLHAATAHFAAREPGALGRIAWTSLLLGSTIGALLAFAAGALILTFPGLVPHVPPTVLVVALLGIPCALLLLFFRHILLGQLRIRAYNAVDLGAKLLTLPVVVLILVVLAGGVREIVVGGFVVSLAMSLLAARLVFRGASPPFILDWSLLRRMFGYGFRSYVSCLLAYLVVRSDLLLVNYFLGASDAGVYAVAVNLADLLLIIPTSVGTMLFPRVSADPRDSGILTAQLCRYTAAAMVLICTVVGFGASPLIRILYGAAFSGAVAPLLLLMPGVLALALETLFMNDLAGRGLPPIVIAVPAVGLVLNVSLNLAFIPRFGLLAASASSSVAYLAMLLVAWKAFSRLTAIPAAACGLLTAADLRALSARLGLTRLGRGTHGAD